MSGLLLQTPAGRSLCFPRELGEKLGFDDAAPIRKLKFDTAGFEHVETGKERRKFGWIVLDKYRPYAWEFLMNASAIEIPILVMAIWAPVMRKLSCKADLDAVDTLPV